MDGKQLRLNVLDELEFDPRINAENIEVGADDGVVTLTGHVSSCAEKLAAERAACRVKGVRAIAQEIEVRYPGDQQAPDDEIAKRALSILKWDAMIPQDDVKVTVQKGRVTLTGEVKWEYQRKAAEGAIQRLSGVTGVKNRILLKPKVLAPKIKTIIEAALARHAHVEAQAIRVSIKDGNKVCLEGKVDSWDERELVENAAWSVAGVQSVDNRLTIVR